MCNFVITENFIKTIDQFINFISKQHKLVLTGSYSYNFNFKNATFEFNDIDFISCQKTNKIDFSNFKNVEIIFEDNFVQKGVFNNKYTFEIIYLNSIPNKFIKQTKEFFIVTKEWSFLSKLVQLISLFSNNLRTEKLKKVLEQILLMSKNLKVKLLLNAKRKIKKIINCILVSSLSFWFFMPTNALRLNFSKDLINSLIRFINEHHKDDNAKTLIRYLKFFAKNTEFENLLNKIKNFLNHSEWIINDYFKFNEYNYLNIDNIEQKFDNSFKVNSYFSFLNVDWLKYEYINKYYKDIYLIKNNIVDIRKMMLWTLFSSKNLIIDDKTK